MKDLLRQLKWAYQRVRYGYDDRFYWSLDYSLAEILVPIMKWYKENDNSYMPVKMGENKYLTKRQRNQVYDKIILGFQGILDDGINTKQINEGLDLFRKYFQHFWT